MITEQEVREKVRKSYVARTPRGEGPRPDFVSVKEYGHHASYVDKTHRVWGFKTEKARNKFIEDFEIATL